MATFLDVSILGHFTSIFTFLLVFVIIYGLLELFKVFGDGRRGLHAIIALAVGFIVLFSSGVVTVIQTFVPWFVIVVILIFFILFAVRMFGVSTAEISGAFKNYTSILTFILIFAAIIILFSLGAGFGQESLERGSTTSSSASNNSAVFNNSQSTSSLDTGNFNQNLYNTIYHPKILGMILIMLIVVTAMLLLTSSSTD